MGVGGTTHSALSHLPKSPGWTFPRVDVSPIVLSEYGNQAVIVGSKWFSRLTLVVCVSSDAAVRCRWRWWHRRAEMVDGEAKASLRSAVADAVLEYRRTCHAAGAEHAQVSYSFCTYWVLSLSNVEMD